MVSWFLGFKVSWFLDFKVSWFQSFLVSKFLGFNASWFLGFKVSEIYQIAISCFLEEIDPISKIFKNSLDGSPGFVGTRLFHHFRNLGFPKA